MNSAKKLSRIAGVLYLLVAVAAGFSYAYIHSYVMVPGDSAATANNITSSEGLYRFSFVCGILAFLCDIALAAIFYTLLKPVNKTLSLTAAFFRLAQTAILGINMLNLFISLTILNGDSFVKTFEPDQLNAFALLFLTAHQYGFDIAMVFFAVHCLILGYLLIKSGYFPKYLGILLIAASVSYAGDSFIKFLLPGYAHITAMIVAVTAIIAEVTLSIWLLARGVRNDEFRKRQVAMN